MAVHGRAVSAINQRVAAICHVCQTFVAALICSFCTVHVHMYHSKAHWVAVHHAGSFLQAACLWQCHPVCVSRLKISFVASMDVSHHATSDTLCNIKHTSRNDLAIWCQTRLPCRLYGFTYKLQNPTAVKVNVKIWDAWAHVYLMDGVQCAKYISFSFLYIPVTHRCKLEHAQIKNDFNFIIDCLYQVVLYY